ncbi:BREX-2 system phosphatase PglZ [Salinispora arenicola]|uniref:BREX-2 system phosphatase PglZ n=1 Tax=Salinispora arenicola TaxID=168697 RepID=UPI0016A19711|nr:BREX-2 system phosphatase PglZ [Salinispora arenicola]NIL64670.1 BREX-2 system phosphatase PglZ [Salinispora arenicola]
MLDRIAAPLTLGEQSLAAVGHRWDERGRRHPTGRADPLLRTQRGCTERRRSRGRASAVIPSVTGVSRTSLLCGRLASGAADTERARFTAFWKSHRLAAELFHKADLPGGAGHRLSPLVLDTISRIDGPDRAVVGVVLNTVDDALDHGREGGRVDWNLGDVAFLPELLAAAKNYGRPVLLVSDHGHVLERERGAPSSDDATSARWRPHNRPPEDGEVELSGDRVLLGDGRIVVPWREDDPVHRPQGRLPRWRLPRRNDRASAGVPARIGRTDAGAMARPVSGTGDASVVVA